MARPTLNKNSALAVFARIAVCMFALHHAAALSQQSQAHGEPDLVGIWQTDLSTGDAQRHIRDYLIRGRELQFKWCGYAWPESEIDRRVAATAKSSLTWEISRMAGGAGYLRRATNEKGEVASRVLSSCAEQGGMLKCRQTCLPGDRTCTPSDVYLRLDGERLYMLAPVQKSMMRCPKTDSSADETHYLSPAYLERRR